MQKDIFLTFAALIIAGAAAFYLLPREGGNSSIAPTFSEGSILGSSAATTPPDTEARAPVRNFLDEYLQATKAEPTQIGLMQARAQLSDELAEQLASDSKEFVQKTTAFLELSNVPSGFEILRITQERDTQAVSVAFELTNGERAVRVLEVLQQARGWLISGVHLE